jgi:hypothetical protein
MYYKYMINSDCKIMKTLTIKRDILKRVCVYIDSKKNVIVLSSICVLKSCKAKWAKKGR